MKTAQQKVETYMKARNWAQGNPGDFAKSISIEAAELLECFQWTNPTSNELKKDKEKFLEVQKELADIFIYGLDLAIILGLDAEKIISKKLAAVKKKYPVRAIKADRNNYYKIKKEYRKKGI